MRITNKNDSHLSSGMCEAIMSDATDIMNQLNGLEDCDLPTWWTSKLAVASAYINSLRDYITYNTEDMLAESEEETEEDEADESPEEQMSEMISGIEQPIEPEDMTDIADEMLPPSVRMMQRATKEG